MPVSGMQWHVEIGIFNISATAKYSKKQSLRIQCSLSSSIFFHFSHVFTTDFISGGDIHLNPGPKRNKSCYNFSIFHWNLNSITAHNYVKSVQKRSYFWSVFSEVNLRIQSEYRKIRTRTNSVFGHFSRSDSYGKMNLLETYKTVNKFDMICIFESDLDLHIRIRFRCTTQSTNLIWFAYPNRT